MRFRLLLVALTVVAFLPTAGAPWLQSDRELLADPVVAAARPVAALAHALLSAPLAAHLFQLALHIATALLAAELFAESLQARAAQVAALLFALHPLQSEAVCSLAARPVVLAALLCLLSWRCWRRGQLWLAAAIFSAAPLAHEQAALFPLVLLLFPGVRRGPVLAMAAFSLLAMIRAPRPPLDLPAAGQLGVAALRDLWLFLLPVRLTPAPELRAAPWAAAFAWGALAAVAVFAAASRHLPAGRWLLVALALMLPSGFLVPALEAGTDRLVYLPMLGLAALAGLLFASASSRVLVPIGLLLLLITYSQVRLWSDERALWTEAVRLAPRSAYPRIRLAAVSDPDQARTLLEEARALQ